MIDPDTLMPPGTYAFSRAPEPAERMLTLARGLASSPVWATMSDAIMVVRPDPPAGLALLGYFSEEDIATIGTLPSQIEVELPRVRYVDYAQAELDCEALAAKLVDRCGSEEVRSMRFTAIPRGGLIVLGMLAYVLDLKREQLVSDDKADRPLVVVDDCSLTGLRFAEFLDRCRSPSVVFAHLYSHPDLRSAIEARESRVIGAVAARDLTDRAADLLSDEYPAWRARWESRANGRSYWVGKPGRLCFAWSEPEATFWNPITQREEEGWRLAPPSACLKNRRALSSLNRLQIQHRGTGSLRVAERTFHGELKGDVIVANLGTGQVVRLSGVAGDIWREIVRHGEREPAVRALTDVYEADPDQLERDVDNLVAELRRRGLLSDSRADGRVPDDR